MRRNILCLFLMTCFFLAQNLEAGLFGRSHSARYGSSQCCEDQSYEGGVDQQNCIPQPTSAYPTICYKPYCYYTPKYHYTCECENVAVPCKKKCCRTVRKYYQKQCVKYVPQCYTQTYCKDVPEYYYEDDCKYCKKYKYVRHCTYEPHYFYKKECAPTEVCQPSYDAVATDYQSYDQGSQGACINNSYTDSSIGNECTYQGQGGGSYDYQSSGNYSYSSGGSCGTSACGVQY